MEVKSNKLQTKDLINVGIFTAIYFVIFFAGMMLGYIPIFIPLLGLVCPILCGIPFMLYLTKVKKFGMVSLTGIILGLLNLIMGSGVLVLIFGIIFGVLGDVLLRAGKYQSWKCTPLANGVFSLWIMGYVSRMFLTRTEFFASLVSSYGQEYVDTTKEYRILLLLVANKGRVLTYAQIYEQVWGDFTTGNENNTIGFHICNLREKLYRANPDAPFYIRSVREVGYSLEVIAE